MDSKQLLNLGVPSSCVSEAVLALKMAAKAGYFKGRTPRRVFKDILDNPESFTENEHFKDFVKSVLKDKISPPPITVKPFEIWGEIDENVLKQMETACSLPVAVQGAVMSDSHLGYGICIGGVLACEDAVVPFGVGVDIGCMVKLSVTDLPVETLEKELKGGGLRRGDKLSEAIENGTRFGVGAKWNPKKDHPVLDKDWGVTRITKEMKDRAWEQLGTSGSGNHFVEIGILTIAERSQINLEPGRYLAILSHSGSRGAGAAVCKEYSDIARAKLPKHYKDKFDYLAWLTMDSEEGQEYWEAMNLMGEYASANHAVIHSTVSKLLGTQIIAEVENQHNLAWRETHNGKDLYVHRKGATPASEGEMGIIPGSMADPCFVVVGKGNSASLRSASHGAGRKLSRTEAKRRFNWPEWKSILKQRGVRLLSAGLDEVPGAYKDIRKVMAEQSDLVDIVAQFDPKIVKMSHDGRAED